MINTSVMQYIMDGNGNYYRLNAKDQLVVANGRNEASVFTLFDANQRISDGKKSKFYQTIPVDDIELETEISASSNDNVISLVKEKSSADCMPDIEYDISSVDWVDYMNLFCYLSESAKDYQEELNQNQSVVDKELCDLFHYIELYDLSDEESLRAVDMIKDARIRRREIKDKMSCVELFKNSLGTSTNVAKAKSCIKDLKKLETRKYHPRELNDLFYGMKHRETTRSSAIKENDIIDFQETECSFKTEERQMEYVRINTIFDGKSNDWSAYSKQQYEFFSNVEQYIINLELDMESIDKAIEDKLTEIEDAKYNVAQGYNVFRELKDLRNERKEKYDELQKLYVIVDCFDCEAMAESYEYVVESISGNEDKVKQEM